MRKARELEELEIEESSGVDHPANLVPGWLVMKQADTATAKDVYSGTTTGTGPTIIYTTGTTGDVSKQATKTEDGKQFRAGDYAYVPDPERPSTWKLRLTNTPGGSPDPRIVGAAVAALGPGGFRGRRVQIPSSDLAAVKRRVRAAWRRANPDKQPADMPAVLKQKGGGVADGIDFDDLADDIRKHIEDLESALAEAKERAETAEAAATAASQREEEQQGELSAPAEIDKAELPPQVRKMLEDAERVRKELDDARDRIAKMERERREQEFIDKAKDLTNLGSAEQTGKLLLDIAESVPSESYQALERMLKSINAQLESNSLFSEVGSTVGDESSLESRIEAAAKELVSKGVAPTIEQATVKVLESNAELRSEYARRR